MFKWLWRYFRGTVEARCDGGLFARFFNRAMEQGLGVFKIKMKGSAVRFHVFISDYKALRPIAKKSQCRLRIERKHGLYFAWRKLPNKTALIAGLLVFCTVITLLGNMVFAIEITGNSMIPKEVLLDSLERNGLRAGMMTGQVDVSSVGRGVLLENERLAWIAVNFSFGIATIEVKDRDAPTQNPRTEGPLVAKRDAQVKSITSTSGLVLVKPGDVVSRGQILVEPLVHLGDSWAAVANATVMAYTEYNTIFTLDAYHVFRTPTGNRTSVRSLRLGQASLPLSFGKSPYAYFDEISYEQPISVFGVEVPWRWAVTEYIEIKQESVQLNRAQAQVLCDQYLKQYEQTDLAGCEILNREAELVEYGAQYIYTVNYLCLENIAVYGTAA